jgi:hypothetical protein
MMKTCRRSFFTWIVTAIVSIFGLPKAAKGASYWPGHNCPRCGRQQLVIYSYGPGRYHTHRCGTTTYWYH